VTERDEQLFEGVEFDELIRTDPLGEWYSGTQVEDGVPVWVRVFAPSFSGHDGALQCIDADMAVAARNLPQTLPFLGCGETSGRRYAIYQGLEGYTVEDWRARKGRLEEADAIAVLQLVVDALSACQDSSGLSHGDLRPENLFVLAEGEILLTPPSTLFSYAARVMHEIDLGPASTYLAPELKAGQHDATVESDMFSLGVLLFNLVTGELPAPIDSEAVTSGGSYLDLTAAQAVGLSEPTLQILERLVATDPASRFPTSAHVAEALAAAELGEPYEMPAAAPSAGRGKRILPFAAAAVLALLFGLVPIMMNRSKEAESPPIHPDQPEAPPPPPEQVDAPAPPPVAEQDDSEPIEDDESPTVAELPDVPAMPEMPAMPSLTEMPAMPSLTAMPAMPSFAGDGGPALEEEAALSEEELRDRALLDYIKLWQEYAAALDSGNHLSARARMLNWLAAEDEHPMRERAEREVARMDQVVDTIGYLELKKSSLIGAQIRVGPGRVGRLDSIENGILKTTVTSGNAQVEMTIKEAELTRADQATLLKRAYPTDYRRRAIILAFGSMHLRTANRWIAGAGHPADLVEWHCEWEAMLANVEAHRFFVRAEEFADSGQINASLVQIDAVLTQFGETELATMKADQLVAFRRELVQRAAEKAEVAGLVEEDVESPGEGEYLGGGEYTPSERVLDPDRFARFLKVLEVEGYGFSRDVRDAYFELQEAETAAALAAMGKELPDEFMEWVHSKELVKATVYGAKPRPENILLTLYSLELDVGQKIVRANPQLPLAAAVLYQHRAHEWDIDPHGAIELEIPECPITPVDTRDPKRTLDVNDHIINWLNEDYKIQLTRDDRKLRPPRHEKDANMSLFDFRKDDEWETEGYIASDVIKSDELKQRLMAYCASKGTPLELPLSEEHVPEDWVGVYGAEFKSAQAKEVFSILKNAYVEKGLMPAAKDPLPTPAERILWLNHVASRSPFPVTKAPWPITILLFERSIPLRSADEIWTAYRKDGRFKTYGNYVGDVAQDGVALNATDCRPFPFAYGSWQDLVKNGGVCGRMANIAVGTYAACGIPAMTAGQPGHCALISIKEGKGNDFRIRIEQSVTAGPDGTSVHRRWPFSDGKYATREYVYSESICNAINVGFKEYLNASIMYNIYRLVPEEIRAEHGFTLLASGLRENVYHIGLLDALREVGTPVDHATFYRWLAGRKTGRWAVNTLYREKAMALVFDRIASAPVVEDRDASEEVLEFLASLSFPRDLKGENLKQARKLERLTLAYRHAVLGERDFMGHMKREIDAHFRDARGRYPELCQRRARRLAIALELIQDDQAESQWLRSLEQIKRGKEDYTAFGFLQPDEWDDERNEAANHYPGYGDLELKDPAAQESKVHFVLSSGKDGSKPFHDPDLRPYRIALRDELADMIDDLVGAEKKPLPGLSALLAGEGARDRRLAEDILTFLEKTKCADHKLLFKYEIAATGEERFLEDEARVFRDYFGPRPRNPLRSLEYATRVQLISEVVEDKDAFQAWARRIFDLVEWGNKETYVTRKMLVGEAPDLELVSCSRTEVLDDVAVLLAEILGEKLEGVSEVSSL